MRRHAAYWIASSAALMTVLMPPLWSQCGPQSVPPPPTLNVTVNPSPLIFGQNATVSVTSPINPPGPCGVVTGAVQLAVDGESYGSLVILANGAATFNIPDPTNNIPGPTVVFPSIGNHSVTVSYGGDTTGCGIRSGGPLLAPRQCVFANYSATVTNPINVAVAQASTTTSLSPATNGTSLTAVVSVVSPGGGSPTGMIVFANNGTTIGSVPVSGGQATLNASGLAGLITATYSGDVDFRSSISAPLRVGPQPTSAVTLTSSLNPSTISQSVTFTASLTVTNGLGPPSGTIQFSDGATLLGSPVTVVGGQASFTTSTLTVGSHSINASYSGDSQYPSAAINFGQVVNRVPTTLSLTTTPSVPATGQAVTITAQLGPQPPTGIPAPTGQVTFSEGLNQLGVAPVSSGATASLQLGSSLTAGTHTYIAVYSGDADWSTVRNTITVTVSAPTGPLTIVTASPLPEGSAGVAYTAPKMSASGGVPPLQWSITQTTPSASGVVLASDGTFSGTPPTPGTFTLTIQVIDAQSTKVSKQFTLQVLGITTQTLPGGTTGSPYSATVAASGGTPPYTFSGSLPANLTIDPASGAISGTPTVTGPVTLTVNVTDSVGTTASKTYTVVFAQPTLPPLPPVTVTGSGNTGPFAQPQIELNLGATFPVAITGTLTLTFKATQGGGDNPEVQFSTGGRTAAFTIPANQTAATFTIPNLQLQTGTVAGLITITADLKASSTDVTPTPVPTEQITISPAPPTISVTATRNATGFTVTVTGFSTTLDMTQAVFQFNGASGGNLQTPSLTISVSALFSRYYQSAAPGPTGSQFVYTQPFTVNGSTAAIASVTVTMANSGGTSAAATAPLQ